MKSKVASLWFFAVALLVGACGDNQAPDDAAATWSRIQAIPYRSMPRAPGYATRTPSTAPHGDSVDIFIDAGSKRALEEKKMLTEWPVGTLIVKDGYDGADLAFVAVMEKRKSGWFFAEYDGEGNAKYSGQPSLCVDCHRSGSDFVRAFKLPQP